MDLRFYSHTLLELRPVTTRFHLNYPVDLRNNVNVFHMILDSDCFNSDAPLTLMAGSFGIIHYLLR